MPNILNYKNNETLATGFVRPKVTSLFFDKIWIPESLLNTSYDYYAIPKEVLLIEKEELKIDNITSPKAGSYYKTLTLRNSGVIPIGKLYQHSEKYNSPISNLPDLIGFAEFKYSKNRNHAILVSSENFNRRYRLHISPVFHDLTAFEKEVQTLDDKKLYRNNSFNYRRKTPNTFKNKEAFSICIQDFPSIKEENLSWEQVLDIRKNKKRIKQLKKFTAWSNKTFVNKRPEYIKETIESALEDYKETLHEYGIKTTLSTFSTIVSSASSIASLITNPDRSLLPLLSISAVSINFAVNTYFSNLKNQNEPIAYLYDIIN